MMDSAIRQLAFYFQAGGFVMPPLAAAAALLWFGIGYRLSVLRRPKKRSVRRITELYVNNPGLKPRGLVERAAAQAVAVWRRHPNHVRRRLDDALADAHAELKKYSRLIKAVVVAAPLLGLLGTVDGMVETFDALGDQRLLSQSGSIAAGISKALFATQLGLAVAIPGLFINGLLERRAHEFRRELEQIKDILCERDAPIRERA